MRIASFNINGIKARAATLAAWLAEEKPDVVCLQELKCPDDAFPTDLVGDLGYNVVTHGQKSFNGVAILSRRPIEDVVRGLPGDEADDQARWIEATIAGEHGAVRVCCLYLPNGNPAPGPKYDYKLAWMARMKTRAEALLAEERVALMAGDYNVIPQDEDAERPEAWRNDALGLPASREAFRRILHLGFTDGFRVLHPEPMAYTFWDYQRGAWARNDGIRIDHLLLTPQAADRLSASGIDRHMRGREKPSDHVPIWVELDI
ncbi:MAG: exodeoxyribonuclease III [Alphaproteobacteria bacterium]|nr:MAG: exodeoxyribonuclease III [Alphaproteobacteria bacterium]